MYATTKSISFLFKSGTKTEVQATYVREAHLEETQGK